MFHTDLLVRVGENAATHVAGVRADRFLLQRDVLVETERIDGDFVVEAARNGDKLRVCCD